MLLKKIALRIYRQLPVVVQRKIVRILYPGYVVAAKVLITDAQGRFLVVKTTYNPDWDIPSGHVDPAESPNLAACRELREETGLTVNAVEQFGVIFYPKLRTVQVLFVHSLETTPELTPDNVEISDLRWVHHGEVTLNPYAAEAIEVILDHKASYWVSDMV